MSFSRRDFIRLCSIAPLGFYLPSTLSLPNKKGSKKKDVYQLFRDPSNNKVRPFVRWWWNGDRLEDREIKRELDVLEEVGIGGVEINPIQFPSKTDSLGIEALDYLSEEWISHLETALEEAEKRGITCDLLVGSGWPYGGEFLEREDQIKLIALETKELEGGQSFEFSQKDLLDEVSPAIMSPNEDEQKELFSIVLAPQELKDLSDCIDLTNQIGQDTIHVEVPKGKFQLYFLTKMTGYMAVINGASGAKGPVLDHYNKSAVERYLNRISDRLSKRIGFLGDHLRSFFTDSFELEGANWAEDMFAEFADRKGYDLEPFFPFILFKIGHMGNAIEEDYGSTVSTTLNKKLQAVRYDFEDVRVQLFKERFIETYVDWCRKNGVKSRMQAYGRPCNPLEASMVLDIPENETWLGNSVGEEFSDEDYRKGRAYSMINKYVSSAAHLSGKQLISCEEMTNTSMVFNASLDDLKVAGDQSILSGVTHSVLHGFNYSPEEASFPGWIQYGTFFNERNTWWKYFKKWVNYKTRLYSVFQESTMQADIAILPPLADLSGKFGFQRDPFPAFAYPEYLFQIWEAIHQNGNGCDYITENIIQDSHVKNGILTYRKRRYKTILIVKAETMLSKTAAMLSKFKSSGGKLIFIEAFPKGLPGKAELSEKQPLIEEELENIKPDAKDIIDSPKKDFVSWFSKIQEGYNLKPYVQIDNPNKFVSQIYYKNNDKDIFFFCNSNKAKSYSLKFRFKVNKKTAWLWNPENGKRFLYPTEGNSNQYRIYLGPSESKLIVFDNESEGEDFKKFKVESGSKPELMELSNSWRITLNSMNGNAEKVKSSKLFDLSKNPKYKNFSGEIIYENDFTLSDSLKPEYLNLGKFYGVAEIQVNDKHVDTSWYGSPFCSISEFIKKGENKIQIKVVTTMGNYVKSLESKIAQKWARDQPLYPKGLLGPVRFY